MTTPMVGAALIALLVDRFVLDRTIGILPKSARSFDLQGVAIRSLPVIGILAPATLAATFIHNALLAPIGAASLFAVLFIALIAGFAFAAEHQFVRKYTYEISGRIGVRAAISSAILGFQVLVPQVDSATWMHVTIDSVIVGILYGAMLLFWNGITERLGEKKGPIRLAQELITASLLAMVIMGISGALVHTRW